jgi:NAD(P)-dependent dehydrogenase (short-subunit alcohol dehydrogenase family)
MTGIADALFDLSGKVAVVTGGSRGLGHEMVHAFAAQGADIVVVSRKSADCEATAAEVRERYQCRALALPTNVSDWTQCDILVEQVYNAFGRVDVLVNNAGLSPLYDSLVGVSEALFDKVIGVNLKGPFRLTARVGERMAADGGGSIINISSVGSIRPSPDYLPYAAAKAGLNALTEGFARAWAPHVRVNGIMAGPFRTDIAKAWDPTQEQEWFGAMAMGRAGEPDEIIGAALYFASAASSFATGAILRVDGGTP